MLSNMIDSPTISKVPRNWYCTFYFLKILSFGVIIDYDQGILSALCLGITQEGIEGTM